MDFPFEGIPTVPPRKDRTHLAFFCAGCRYRVTAEPSWTVAAVKQVGPGCRGYQSVAPGVAKHVF